MKFVIEIPRGKRSLLARLVLSFCAALFFAGCSTLASRGNNGVVVSQRAQIRSSTAVVAADLLEVARGDSVEILDSTEVLDPTDNTKTEMWYRVRASDVDKTEGWIEARNVMPEDVLEKSRKLAEESKDIQGQATGQLHASSNLRLTPDRTTNENIMMRLDSGSSFEIVGWKRVPRAKESEAGESDVAPKRGTAAVPTRRTGRSDERTEEEQETTELWYKVRLSPENSPAPAGWIFGKQVELTVPSDIIYYRTGREFVAWRRLDEEPSDEASSATKTKDVARESRPGSWVILERSAAKGPRKLDDPDFDRIYVLGYEKHDQDHYTAYRSPDVEGYLPVRVEGRGANKTFTVRIKDESGQVKDMTFRLYRDQHGVMRVNAPEQIKTAKKR